MLPAPVKLSHSKAVMQVYFLAISGFPTPVLALPYFHTPRCVLRRRTETSTSVESTRFSIALMLRVWLNGRSLYFLRAKKTKQIHIGYKRLMRALQNGVEQLISRESPIVKSAAALADAALLFCGIIITNENTTNLTISRGTRAISWCEHALES